MERTRLELASAAVVLAVFEAGVGVEPPLEDLPAGAARIDVFNKLDLAPGFRAPERPHAVVAVSAKTGAGMDALRNTILRAAGWSSTGESVFLARQRHLDALGRARGHLEVAARESEQWEFFAEELRLAQVALGEITGELTADDLLGEIFARFCVGK
jgi:tRNA modification GTPase